MVLKKDYALENMAADELNQLWSKIKNVYERHFNTAFNDDYLIQKCKGTRIARLRVIWNNDQAVGIVLLFANTVKVNGKNIILYRGSAAIDKAYRDKNNLSSFMFLNTFGQILRNCFQRQYIVEGFVHPSSFSVVQKSLAQVYPSLHRPTPHTIKKLMQGIKEQGVLTRFEFNYENPFLAKFEYNVAETMQETHTWQQKVKADKYAQYFHDSGAMEKDMLLVCVVPLTLSNFILSITKSTIQKWKRHFSKQVKENVLIKKLTVVRN